MKQTWALILVRQIRLPVGISVEESVVAAVVRVSVGELAVGVESISSTTSWIWEIKNKIYLC